jgi:hypothetical protein
MRCGELREAFEDVYPDHELTDEGEAVLDRVADEVQDAYYSGDDDHAPWEVYLKAADELQAAGL